jgi:hypothetical protein
MMHDLYTISIISRVRIICECGENIYADLPEQALVMLESHRTMHKMMDSGVDDVVEIERMVVDGD